MSGNPTGIKLSENGRENHKRREGKHLLSKVKSSDREKCQECRTTRQQDVCIEMKAESERSAVSFMCKYPLQRKISITRYVIHTIVHEKNRMKVLYFLIARIVEAIIKSVPAKSYEANQKQRLGKIRE